MNGIHPGIKFGLHGSAVFILLSLIFYFAGLGDSEDNGIVKMIGYAVYIIAVYLAIREKKADQGGFITFSKAFSTGFRVILVIACLLIVYYYLYYSGINTEAMEAKRAAIEPEIERQIEQSNGTEEQADMSRRVSHILVSPLGLAMVYALGVLILGTIISLVEAAIFKKDPPAGPFGSNYPGGNNGNYTPYHRDPNELDSRNEPQA